MKKITLLFLSILSFGWGFSQSDNCATATTMDLSSGSACATGTTVNATSTNTMYSNCNANPINEVWYTYVTNGSVNTFDITPSGMTNAQIVIYTGGCADFLELCDNASGSNPVSVDWGIPAGTQVWVGVMSNEGNEGGFDLCITSTAPDPSGGNTCSGAIEICDPNDVLTIDMSTLNASGEWPSCFTASANQDVFFQFTVLQTGTIEWEATPTGTTSGVELDWAMYDISSGCNSNDIDCNYNYDGGSGGSAGMSSNPPNGPSGNEYNSPYTVTAGNTYAILVDYYTGGSTGTMDFQITGGTAVITPTADFTISPTTVQCAPSVDVSITDNSIGSTSWTFGNGNTYNGNNPPNQTFLASGSYALTATSTAGNCTSTHTEYIQVFGPLAVTSSSTDETCAGDCDGSASVQATGGSGSYDYSWSPGGSTTPTVSGLCSGAVSVTVTDPVCNTSQTENLTISGPNCANCLITWFSTSIQACNLNTGNYQATGQIDFVDPPTSGDLVIQIDNGTTVYDTIISFPFPATDGNPQTADDINWSISNIPADGTGSTITAYFTDDAACTYSNTFTAPTCPCAIGFSSVQGFCEAATNSFQVNGDLSLPGGPTTGTINVEIDNGTAVYDTIINPPFVDGQTWSISGIPADGANYTITVYYSIDPTCAISDVGTAPFGCACSAVINTVDPSLVGDGQADYVLCYGDAIDITVSNWVPADEAINPPITDSDPNAGYRPGIGWLIYSCPPSISAPDDLFDYTTNPPTPLDPCYVGFIAIGETFTDVNVLGSPSYNGNWTDNTMYYVPITLYDTVQGYISFVNTTEACYDLGTPTAVQYLPEITYTEVPDCQTGTSTITINGGQPALDGTYFAVSNLSPATASFSNTTAPNGGTVVINGLQNGDMYSFDIVDVNGCPVTVSGGPFVGLPTADAGTDDSICALTYSLSANPSFGTGTWSSTGGATFSNASSPTSSVTVSSAGSYTFTWTENNGGGCTDSDDVTIVFSNLQYTDVTNDPTCGNPDGDITLSGNSGITAYSYSIDGGTTTQASGAFTGLSAGNYNVVVEDAIGCQVTGTITLTDLGGPVIDAINSNDISCNAACNGDISISATGATQFSIDNGANFSTVNTFNSLCAGNYDIVVQDALGCQATGTATLVEPDPLTHTTTQADLLCANDCNGQITISQSGGTSPFQFSIDNGTTNQSTGSFQNLCVGTYDVLVTDANNCTTSSTVSLTEPSPLTVTIGITDASCYGMCDGMMNSIPAGGTGAGTYNYVWTPAVAGNVPLVTNLCAGSYSLSITDGNGCVLDTTGIVVGAPQPVTIDNIPTVDETCGGSCDGSLTINSTGGTQYSIDGNNFGANNTFSNLCAGTYTVYAQDVNGCSATDQATIIGPPPVTVVADGSTTICIGQTTTITSIAGGGVGGYTYSWDNGGTTQNINVTPTSSQTYCVVATDANGCPSPSSCATVNLNPPLSVIALSDQSICEGDNASITAVGSGGNGGPYTYTWDQGVGSGQTQSVSPLYTTDYTVTLSDGCTTPDATAGVTITVNTIPNISFSADNFDGCYPVSVNFTEMNVPTGSSCLWIFGDGGASTDCNNPNYSFENPGCWDVTLEITTPEGCEATSTIQDYICVYDYPTPYFTFDPQPTTILEPLINFTNLTDGATDYTWTFDPLTGAQSTATNPSYAFGDVGSYEVCLDAISIEGCPAQYCDTVVILEEFVVYVPNAFTPDGDDVNDGFAPIISGVIPDSYEFLVFNRWGELIFQSQIVGQAWDGTYKNLMSQEDVYVWKLKVDDQLGETHQYIGHVTLIK